MTGRVILRPGRLLPLLLFAPAGLLFLPVFYYSLNTPFGLVDDYSILSGWEAPGFAAAAGLCGQLGPRRTVCAGGAVVGGVCEVGR